MIFFNPGSVGESRNCPEPRSGKSKQDIVTPIISKQRRY